MRKIKAFTLIEVMVSIFIFTIAMLGYMAFHAHSMSVIFDNESAQFAHALAFNLIEEINSMSYEDFKELAKETAAGPGSNSAGKKDSEILANKPHYFGSSYGYSPFFLAEYADYKSYRFNRYIVTRKYASDEVSGTYAMPGTFLSTLYEVRVTVVWPKRGYGHVDCVPGQSGSDVSCNSVSLPLVRSNKQTFKVQQ